MLLRVILLELRKHRKDFFSLLIVLFASLLVISVIIDFSSRHHSFEEAFWRTVLFLLMGWPLLWLFFGVSFGSGLSRSADRTVEEALPVKPYIRVLGSYLASWVYLLPFLILGQYLRSQFQFFFGEALTFTEIDVMVPVHLYAFVLGYAFYQPVLATGLAAILFLVQRFFLSDSPFLVLTALFFGLILLYPLSQRVERKKLGAFWSVCLILALLFLPWFGGPIVFLFFALSW